MDHGDTNPSGAAGQIGLVVAGDGGARAKPADAPPPEDAPQFSTNALFQALAQTVVSTFTDRLKLEAQRHGGYLTVSDISQLAEEFDRKRGHLEKVFQQSFEQVARARERAVFDHVRAYPFDRLIVNTFEELFARERAAADGADAVTRRVLPGFFLSMDMMVGKDMVEEFQDRCRKSSPVCPGARSNPSTGRCCMTTAKPRIAAWMRWSPLCPISKTGRNAAIGTCR